MNTLEQIKKQFKNPELFDHALTHRSWVNEHKGVRTSNERLEFLGDAILEFIVSREIYSRFPDKEEGYLTALRANIVNTQALWEVAQNLNLGESIHLSKGEVDGGGRTNSSLLADTVEALIGALFTDSGLEASEKFIRENILTDVENKAQSQLKDPKSMLQEYVQSKGLPTPKYVVISSSGPDHNKIFEIEVMVADTVYGKGTGKSKSQAQTEAAKNALSMLQ